MAGFPNDGNDFMFYDDADYRVADGRQVRFWGDVLFNGSGGVFEDVTYHLIGSGSDSTIGIHKAMDKAIASGRILYIPYNALGYSLESQIIVPSNLSILANRAVLINNIPSTTTTALTMTGVTNVVIQGLEIDGNKSAYAPVTEHRHGISINNSNRIRLINIKSRNNKGDGLYIGHSTLGLSEDIQVFGSNFDDNHRNNLSIIQGRNLKFFGCTFDRSIGTAPQSGVDIEPNEVDDVIEDIQFFGCTANGNGNDGFLISLKISPTAVQRNIRYYGCTAKNNGTNGYYFLTPNDVQIIGGSTSENGRSGIDIRSSGPSGNIYIDTTSENNGWHGFYLSAGVITGVTLKGYFWHNSASISNTYDGIHSAGTAGTELTILPGTVAGGPVTGARQRHGLRAGSGTILTHVGCLFPNNLTSRTNITANNPVQINETDWTIPSFLRMPTLAGGPFVKLALAGNLATGTDTDLAYGLGMKPTSTHAVTNLRGGITSATSSGVDIQVNGTDAVQNRGTAIGTAFSKFIDRFLELNEITDPAAPAVNNARLFTKDNGAGKTQLCIRFPTGAIQVISTEP